MPVTPRPGISWAGPLAALIGLLGRAYSAQALCTNRVVRAVSGRPVQNPLT
jgi:hypothetical protein